MIEVSHKLPADGSGGGIEFSDSADQLPQEAWAELVRERRRWLWSEGYPLLQMLETFLADAPQLAVALGYADTTALLREGYGLELVLGEGAERWLKLLGQAQPAARDQKICACCGVRFQARRQDARYCSSTCRSRVSRRRRISGGSRSSPRTNPGAKANSFAASQ